MAQNIHYEIIHNPIEGVQQDINILYERLPQINNLMMFINHMNREEYDDYYDRANLEIKQILGEDFPDKRSYNKIIHVVMPYNNDFVGRFTQLDLEIFIDRVCTNQFRVKRLSDHELDLLFNLILPVFKHVFENWTDSRMKKLERAMKPASCESKEIECTVCQSGFHTHEQSHDLSSAAEDAPKSEPEDADPCIVLLCGHHFHKECILPWLSSHHTCPNCRAKVVDE
jgi:Ring finger domain